jgi:hypothetical protein
LGDAPGVPAALELSRQPDLHDLKGERFGHESFA